jgi:outer membrane protein assembly factor BamA
LTPALIFDTRDDELSPSSGVFISSSFELAHPDLLSQTNPYPVGYTRFQFRSDFFLPLGKKSTWYFSFRTGFERSLEQHNPAICSSGDTGCINFDGAIPFSKQYALGGVGSLRGYGEQELNYENRYVYGILSYVNYRTQLDVPFIGGCRFGPFLDVANLQIDSYSLTNNLIFGAGIGFHYQTPVGPVNLDWGFPLNQISTLFSSPTPNPPQDSYHFYFSIGII